MILIIDNYDSFTYNLVQYLGEILLDEPYNLSADQLEDRIQVYRNDKISLKELEKLEPNRVVISPGPCTPKEAGISNEVIKQFAGKFPMLGVCLGHQCIGYSFGGEVVRAERLMHGKTSMIHHDGQVIFSGVQNPFEATRYHSLIIKKDSIPEWLKVTAWTDQDEVMGVKHKDYPIWGLQFHPESILTVEGKKILRNFLQM